MNKIYVGNLPFQLNEDDLANVFQPFGEIKEIALIKDRYTNQFKGFVFITFATQESAEKALSMDGKDFGGRPMKVNMARENERRPGGGGAGGAGGGRKFRGNDRRSGGGGERRDRW